MFQFRVFFSFLLGVFKKRVVKFYHKGLKKVNAMLDKEEGRPLVVLEAKHSYGLKFDDSHL
jgi:hypothetical protein